MVRKNVELTDEELFVEPERSAYRVPTSDWFKEDRSAAFALTDWGPSLTRQEFADESDINVLMKRYELTGIMPSVGVEPTYLDWTQQPTDLASAMDIMIAAEAAFMQLPAVVRRQFDNDAVAFTDFAADPANLDQMRVWGLAPPKPVPDAPREGAGSSERGAAADPAPSAQDAPKAS